MTNIYKWRLEKKRRTMEGKVIVKGKEMTWGQNRMGLVKYLLHPNNWPEVGVTSWSASIQRINNHFGKHRHQGGFGIFVLEGKGYTIVDGIRYDWEKDDLIILPVKPDECEHQHFNANPSGPPAEWVAFRFDPFRDAMGNELEDLATSPDWKGAQFRE